jgi:hypothetical protein
MSAPGLTTDSIVIVGANNKPVIRLIAPGVIQFLAEDGSIATELTAATVIDLANRTKNIIKIGSGETPAGNTNWQPYLGGTTGILVDVDTSAAGFTSTPHYVASIAGISSHWATTGGSSIYDPTPTRFRVYVRYSDGGSITPAQANEHKWRISWIGVQGI